MPLNDTTKRLQWLLWGFMAWSGLLLGRLVMLQVVHHTEYQLAADRQQRKVVEVPAPRGVILDRTGSPLAITLDAYTLVVDPQKLKDLPQAAHLFASVLPLDAHRLQARLESAKAHNSHHVQVLRKLTPEESQKVSDFKLAGVEFEKDQRRFYPRHEMAANLLGATGFVNPEDVQEHGNGGIELAYEKDLQGKTGEVRLYRDPRNNKPNVYDQDVLRAPVPGAALMLTIEPNLQYRAEQELKKAVDSSGAEAGTVTAMDPYTGEILAMASYPTFDPNEPPVGGSEAIRARQNLVVTRTFEPGSVYKVITLSAALETTNLRPESIIDCGNGQMNLFGRVIHDHNNYRSLTMAEVLAKSSNIGAIHIALATGNDNFYAYQRKFGFGDKTGVALPGESAGILWSPLKWTKSSIGSLAMGHELGVTSLQLARAGAVIANGGVLIKPRLVISRQRAGEPVEKFPQEQGTRIMKPENVATMRQMMEGVVLEGTGKKAVMQGYTSAGKTGSAQVYDQKAKVYTHTYNASFLGFAPVSNPRVVIAVSLFGTKGGSAGFGGAVAAPVFREVAMTAMRVLDVHKDLPDVHLVSKNKTDENDLSDHGQNDAKVAVEAARRARLEETSPDFAHGDSTMRLTNPSGRDKRSPNGVTQDDVLRARAVSSVTTPPVQGASPGNGDSTGRRPFLKQDEQPQIQTASLTVPDFRGKTRRGVMQVSMAEGLRVEMTGEGLAAQQDPLPGETLRPGRPVKVFLAQ